MSGMEKTLFNMKFTAKQLERESKAMERKRAEQDSKAMAAGDKGDMERMRIYASEALRNKHMSLQYVRLAARIDAVASRVETAIRMRSFAKSLGSVSSGMESVLSSMDPTRINAMMDKFEKQFESLDVGVATMDESISRATASVTPEDELSEYMEQLKARAELRSADASRAAGVGTGMPAMPGAAAADAGRIAAPAGMPAPPPGGPPAAGGGAAGGGGAGAAPGGGGGGGGGGNDLAASLQARLDALRGKK